MNDQSSELTRPLTVNEWFITILVLAIPLVNFVMYIYWAVAEGVNLNKRNFCRASIAWVVIGVILGVFIVAMGGLAALIGNSN